MTALEKATGDVVLKFEPFVLHVLCQELRDAQLLVKLHQVTMLYCRSVIFLAVKVEVLSPE